MKTWNAKSGEVERKWHVVDATDVPVGRLATTVATILRGKHKPTYTPHVDTGDFVVVVNTDKVKFTGNKWDNKKYFRHTGFMGGIKELSAKQTLEKDSTLIVESAVRGMLPKNRLNRKILKKLKMYTGAEHPHITQKPEALTINRK